MGWNLFILYRQKEAWRSYAARMKLRYRATSFFRSPDVSGTVDGYTVSILVGEHLIADGRSSRKLSAVEVQLSSKMPFDGGVASGGMVQILQGVALKEEFRPSHPKWDKEYIAVASSRFALEAYLTPERIEALGTLMKIKNGWVILLFRGDTMLLRFDTPDPLDKTEKLAKLVARMIEVARILELKAGESGTLKAEATRKPVKEINLDASRTGDSGISLALEEDPKPAELPPSEKT